LNKAFYLLIQVDICGHPPVPNSNWLILTFFISTRFFVMGKFLCNCGFFTYGVVLKPYKTSRWILGSGFHHHELSIGIYMEYASVSVGKGSGGGDHISAGGHNNYLLRGEKGPRPLGLE
jgi:hypothetical protein